MRDIDTRSACELAYRGKLMIVSVLAERRLSWNENDRLPKTLGRQHSANSRMRDDDGCIAKDLIKVLRLDILIHFMFCGV